MSFLSCTKAACLARRTFIPAMLVALSALISGPASQAAIVVSADFVGSNVVGGNLVADGSTPTAFTLRYIVNLTDSGDNFLASGMGGTFDWTYSGGVPSVLEFASITGENGIFNPTAVPGGIEINRTVSEANGTFNFGLTIDSIAESVSLTDANTPSSVVDISFTLAAGIDSGSLTFNLSDDFNDGNAFSDQTGTNFLSYTTTTPAVLQVVPEPSTMYSLFAVGLVTTGVQIRRLRRRKAA